MTSSKIEKPDFGSLHPHQENFLESYFSEPEVKVRCLVAPPSSGSMVALVVLILKLFAANRSARVLFLAERKELLFRVSNIIRNRDIEIFLLDRFKYRELEDVDGPEENGWANGGIYLSTSQFAVRDDTRNKFLCTPWDLVIIDGIPSQGTKKSEFISDLILGSNACSAILHSDRHVLPETGLLPESAVVTMWRLRDLVTADGEPLWRPGNTCFEPLIFQLTPEDIEIQRGVKEIYDLWNRFKSIEDAPPATLFEIYPSESALNILRAQFLQERNNAAHSVKSEGNQVKSLEFFEEILEKIDRVLEMIDTREVDSKMEALIAKLTKFSSTDTKILIIPKFKVTAEYLVASLEPYFDSLNILSGSSSPEDRQSSIQQFSERGGVLVAPMAIWQNVDIMDVDMFIPYERPNTINSAISLLSNLIRIGREKPLSILVPEGEGCPGLGKGRTLSLFRKALAEIEGTDQLQK